MVKIIVLKGYDVGKEVFAVQKSYGMEKVIFQVQPLAEVKKEYDRQAKIFNKFRAAKRKNYWNAFCGWLRNKRLSALEKIPHK